VKALWLLPLSAAALLPAAPASKCDDLAARSFGKEVTIQSAALVAALRNVTRAKFRQAVNTLTETRTALAGKKPVSIGRYRQVLGKSYA
jgi:hypothetical protein